MRSIRLLLKHLNLHRTSLNLPSKVKSFNSSSSFSSIQKHCLSCLLLLGLSRFPFIERVFYDDTWNGRNPTEKFLEPLQTLIRLGESVSDSQLQRYKEAVRPEWAMHHLFTSVSSN